MKRNSILILVLGLFFIAGGMIIALFTDMSKESANIINIGEQVNDNYSKFEQDIEVFNNERKIFNEEIVNNLFVEEVFDNYYDWIKILDNYHDSVSKINNYKKFLLDNCFYDDYINSNVKSKCNSMINSYETVINYYVKDIQRFNKLLEVYNDGKDENEYVQLYSLDGFNLIDFNDDGKYKGFE